MADERLLFLKELVSEVPDVQGDEEPYETPPVRPKLTGVRKLRAKNGSSDGAGPSHSTAEETDSAEDDEDDYLGEETDDGSSENTAEAPPSMAAYRSVQNPPYIQPPIFPPTVQKLPQFAAANIMASVATVEPDDDYDS